MSIDPLSKPELELLDERPRQFGLIHLMGLLTVLAFAFALLAPLFRAMSGRQATSVSIILLIEVAVFAGTYLYSSSQREKVLSVAGRRVGQSNVGMAKSRAFGRIATACGFLFLAALQVAVTFIAIGLSNHAFPWFMLINQVQMGYFACTALMQLRWDRDVGAIEFFEHGLVMNSFHFTSWERIIVRPCKLYQHGVNLHIQSGTKHMGQTMMVVFVSDPLKQYLLKHHGEETASNEKSPS